MLCEIMPKFITPATINWKFKFSYSSARNSGLSTIPNNQSLYRSLNKDTKGGGARRSTCKVGMVVDLYSDLENDGVLNLQLNPIVQAVVYLKILHMEAIKLDC